MRLGILSDIHSNYFALKSVIDEAKKESLDGYIILGDIFGYYPWAIETYNLIREIDIFKIIKGNHDMIITEESFEIEIDYWEMAQENKKSLLSIYPESILWLRNLKHYYTFNINNSIECSLFHGTPDDPVNGRYYPDDEKDYNWFPAHNKIIMLGHTHYPLLRKKSNGGYIINPGSVGQPRDGITDSSWVVFDTIKLAFKFKRTKYDLSKAVKTLIEMNWDRRAIDSLQKNYKGPLNLNRFKKKN